MTLACVIATMSASPAWASRTTQPTYWFCNAQYSAMGSPFIVTEVVEVQPGVYSDEPRKEWTAWLDAALAGKVPLEFDRAAVSLRGGCRGFFTRADAQSELEKSLRLDRYLRLIPSPLDASGRVSIPGRGVSAAAVPKAAPKGKVATGAASPPPPAAKASLASAAGSATSTPKAPVPAAVGSKKPVGPGPGRVTRRVVSPITKGTEADARKRLNWLHERYPDRYSEVRNVKCFDMSKGAGRAWSCTGDQDQPATRPQSAGKQ